jgi:NAD(P) transhydrogenase subunit beta
LHGVAVDPLITNLTVFVLAVFVGYHVVWNVTPALHTPLMSVTNAISSVIIVGAILAAGATASGLGSILGAAAVGARRHQHLRRLPRHRAHARNVQEEGPEEVMATAQLLSPNQVALLYLVASVLFILALKGLSHPLSARQGNRFGIVGMVIAVLVTFAMTQSVTLSIARSWWAGLIGWYAAKRVEMTQMPELVAAMHSLVGLAAVLIATAVVSAPTAFNLAGTDSRRQPHRALPRHVHRRDDLLGIGDRVRQAGRPGQQVPAVLERADRVQGAADGQPADVPGDDRLRDRVLRRRRRTRSGRRSSS